MEIFSLFSQNLCSPPILFFILGIIAGFVKSDLNVPDQISRYLSIYLMMAIGFRGGVAITEAPELNYQLLQVTFAGIGMSLLMPFVSYFILRLTTKIDVDTAAAISAHYGSISMVTFVTAISFLESQQVDYQGYMVAVLALMEAPAIITGLFLAYKNADHGNFSEMRVFNICKEIFSNGAILLLTGSFVIGCLSGASGMTKMEGFFVTPFHGILAFFLLDMGLLVAKHLHQLREFTFKLASFAFYMPIIGASIGFLIAKVIGLDSGTGMLFIILTASSSYIAVTAAIRIALPEAKLAIYLPMSLALTFPFNILIGLPIYFQLAQNYL